VQIAKTKRIKIGHGVILKGKNMKNRGKTMIE
jgi:hypothetical protein